MYLKILGCYTLKSYVARFLFDPFTFIITIIKSLFLKFGLRVTSSALRVTVKLRVTCYFCWNCKLRITSSTLKLQVNKIKCQLNFVTRKDFELSRKCKLHSLKYWDLQIITFKIFSSYLFHLNEINNDGIVAGVIVAVLWQWRWTTLSEIKNTATNTLFLVGHSVKTLFLDNTFI